MENLENALKTKLKLQKLSHSILNDESFKEVFTYNERQQWNDIINGELSSVCFYISKFLTKNLKKTL